MSTSVAQPIHRDAVLVEFLMKGQGPHALAEGLIRLGVELAIARGGLQACKAESEPWVTAYFWGAWGKPDIAAAGALVRDRLSRLTDGPIEVSRLAGVRAFPGASPAATPQYRYVVRTDVTSGGEEELERWYDEEHMPSLAAVEGVVFAQRLVSLDVSPRYYASYDLAAPDVLTSPAWLDVRATPWSGRVRPTFRNTRRIVSRRWLDMGL